MAKYRLVKTTDGKTGVVVTPKYLALGIAKKAAGGCLGGMQAVEKAAEKAKQRTKSAAVWIWDRIFGDDFSELDPKMMDRLEADLRKRKKELDRTENYRDEGGFVTNEYEDYLATKQAVRNLREYCYLFREMKVLLIATLAFNLATVCIVRAMWM